MSDNAKTVQTVTAQPIQTESVNNSNAEVISSDGVSLTGDSAAMFAELVDASAKMGDMEEVLTLSASYMELNTPGESFRGIFFGYQPAAMTDKNTGELREMEAARFIVNRKVIINAGVSLVKECKNAGLAVGTPIMVTYEKRDGQTKIYSVTLLGQKKKK